jgi:hypothetical protein
MRIMAAGRGPLILVVGLFVFGCQALGQRQLIRGSQPSLGCPNEVFNPIGWTIPGFRHVPPEAPGQPLAVSGVRWENVEE